MTRTYSVTDVKFNAELADSQWAARLQTAGKIGAWCVDLATSECWWSDAVYELYGVEKNLEFAPDFSDFFQDGSDAKIKEGLANAVENGLPWDIEAPFLSAKGELLWVRSTGEVAQGPNGKRLLGCFQDITEYQKMRLESLAAVRFAEKILDNIPHMIFVKEAKDLRFVRFNKAGERLLGVQSKDLVGRNDYDFFPVDQADHFVAKDRHTLKEGVTLDIPEEAIDTPTGRRILHTKKITVSDDAGVPLYLLGISEDITHRNEQQKIIEDQRIALAGSARLSALGEMAGGIAHEINNPLAIIGGVADQIRLIVATGELDAERLTKLSGMLQNTVQRVAKIVTGLRDFSRDGTGDPFAAIRLETLVEQTLALCSEKFRTKGVEVHLQLGAPDLALVCQSVRVSQVLINLLNNAFDALMESGQSNREIHVEAATVADGTWVEISVQDNGPGVPEEILPKIMAPFFTTKPLGKGTGLGLSIAKGICESQGGRLEHRPSKVGARFVAVLPIARGG